MFLLSPTVDSTIPPPQHFCYEMPLDRERNLICLRERIRKRKRSIQAANEALWKFIIFYLITLLWCVLLYGIVLQKSLLWLNIWAWLVPWFLKFPSRALLFQNSNSCCFTVRYHYFQWGMSRAAVYNCSKVAVKIDYKKPVLVLEW